MNVYERFVAALLAVLLLVCCFSSSVFAASNEQFTLSAWDRAENLAFQMTNMVPGDSETKEYAVKINDKRAVSLRFSVESKGADKSLADVLHIKVEQGNDILYDGMLAEMSELAVRLAKEMPQTLKFRITVSLDTSVGNEYMGKTFSADFNWSIIRQPYTPSSSIETTVATHTTAVETTTQTSVTETTEQTTTESSSAEITVEQTTEITTVESTQETVIEQTETESSSIEPPTIIDHPIEAKPCCECCIGYRFPYSCNFGHLGERDIGCDLPWCCAGGNRCICPWCWIIPLIILIVLTVILIIMIRKLTKKDKEENKEEKENEDEETTEKNR